MIDESRLIDNLKKEWEELCYYSENVETLLEYVIRFIGSQPKIGGWIPCSERLPEEHDSIFAKFKGTDKWSNAMFEKTSNEVNATIEFEDGKRTVKTLHTIDGRWNEGNRGIKFKVIAWQPLPASYEVKTDEQRCKTRNFTVKVFFNDGTQISIDCDDFIATENRFYYAERNGVAIMTFPFSSVKYTITVDNRSEAENEQMDKIQPKPK